MYKICIYIYTNIWVLYIKRAQSVVQMLGHYTHYECNELFMTADN